MNLKKKAEALPKTLRKQIIMEFRETDLHKFLKELFQVMETDYTVEITHGTQEFGKDLVMVKNKGLITHVIGIVVKCGNINGKTLGDVDALKSHTKDVLSKGTTIKIEEIRSQIEQAETHPAETKSILEDLPVSTVYVVLAGEFSKNARKRLINELTTAITIEVLDIHWLIDNFTEFYPEIFFEGRVINFLEKKTSELEENHRLRESGKNLSEYFVDPLIRSFNTPLEFDKKVIKTVWNNRKLPFLRLLEISKRNRKLVLLGDPGTGKTGAMAKLAIDMYQDAYRQLLKKPGKTDGEISVPILVTARKFLESEAPDGFLETYFESEETKSRFNVNVVIVDGLDEIESSKRKVVIDKLDEFSETLGCSYILTSRKVDILNTLPERYEKYELLPFEFSQALKLVSKLINDHNILAAMKESLTRIQTQIHFVPLSLMLLVELVEEHKEVPASVTELYDRFFDMALGREDREKGINVLFDYLIKKRFLSTLAFREFREKDRLALPREEFEEFLSSYSDQYQWNPEKFNNFVREIERAGILNGRSEVIFKHRSFLDYFTAFHVHENRGEISNLNELIVDTYFDSIWSEVAFFYIGLRREISQELLEMIYSHADEELTSDVNKLLSGRLLQAGWHSPPQQLVYGIENAIQYVPKIRKKFKDLIASADANIPGIIPDFIALSLCDFSFNSAFLERHVKNLLEYLVTQNSKDDLYIAVILLWSMRRFMEPDEVETNINAILDKLTNLPKAEQVRLLLLMTLIEEDKKIHKLIRKQLGKLKKSSPAAFKALLPAKRKGFR